MSVALGGLQAAAAQAAVGRGAAAADDLQLLLGAVRPVQQLLDELLQTHLGVGLARRRLLEELVDLCNFPGGRKERRNGENVNERPLLSALYYGLALKIRLILGQQH